MAIQFRSAPYEDAAPRLAAHLQSQVGWIDSYHEKHVRESNHYLIEHDGVNIGNAAIHDAQVITAFVIDPAWRHLSQEIYAALRKQEKVTAAFVSTTDGFFLANAIDNVHEIKRQAYAFALAPDRVLPSTGGYSMEVATRTDVPLFRELSGDFFFPDIESIDDPPGFDEFYMIKRGADLVALGISQKSQLYTATISIGMFVIESERKGGVGTATIGLLIDEMVRRGLEVTAGCWYYNHASKRTLERAGMHAISRWLRIEY